MAEQTKKQEEQTEPQATQEVEPQKEDSTPSTDPQPQEQQPQDDQLQSASQDDVPSDEGQAVEQGTVQEAEPQGNGIRIEDVATKDYVQEMLEALNAKLEAVIQENSALKDKLAEAQTQAEDVRKKYEEGDFGGFASRGVASGTKNSYGSFDEYAKQFM